MALFLLSEYTIFLYALEQSIHLVFEYVNLLFFYVFKILKMFVHHIYQDNEH